MHTSIQPSSTAPMPPPGIRRPPVAAGPWVLGPDLLRQMPLLSALDEDTLAWLGRRVALRRFTRGTRLIEQDQPSNQVFFMLKGTAHALREGDDQRSMIIDLLGAGDHFGEMAVIDDEPNSMSVRCNTSSDVLVLRGDDFLHCLHASEGLRTALLHTLVKRMRKRNQHIALLALSDVRGRVLRHMLDVCDDQDGQRVVAGRINRQRLANMVGASREMVSRVLRTLAQSGAIEVRRDGSTLIHCSATD